MLFYLVFTAMFMRGISLLQARQQVGVGNHASLVLLGYGLAVSLLLASTSAMPDTWSLDF